MWKVNILLSNPHFVEFGRLEKCISEVCGRFVNNLANPGISMLFAVLRQILHKLFHITHPMWKSCGESENFSTNSQFIHCLATEKCRCFIIRTHFPDTFLSIDFLSVQLLSCHGSIDYPGRRQRIALQKLSECSFVLVNFDVYRNYV